jgi:two-component system, OmpR family, alkaline phosphatase synthesis response regulator PhoP
MQELILVVDDEPKVTRLARDYLEKYGFRVITAADGNTALQMARQEHPALLVLDLMLPGLDGREVCRILRGESNVPIIMLTALAEESDQIVGLELGADDYIVKPFSPRALVARVRAMLRRSQGPVTPPLRISIGGVEVDDAAHTINLDSTPIHLTPNEFKLFVTIARRPGQTLTREQLMDELYGTGPAGFDRSIDSHIKNLRKKLENARLEIETVYGIGYRLIEQESL